jgi:cytochrome d ubiquinol oxidase subunit I
MTTKDGVSPSVSTTELAISIVVFLLVYAALGFVDVFLMLRYGRRGLELEPDDETDDVDEPPGDRPVPALTY